MRSMGGLHKMGEACLMKESGRSSSLSTTVMARACERPAISPCRAREEEGRGGREGGGGGPEGQAP